ncbi:MAG: arylesterase [Castellaniella sp.]
MMRRRVLMAVLSMSALSLAGRVGAEPPAPSILVVGDSLSAEYGLARNEGWVARITQRLGDGGHPHTMHNSSISGDTTSGGLSRLSGELDRLRPGIVILELGSNDALRGLPLSMTRSNLARMIALSQAAGAQVLLLGMQIPPNYGPQYAREFAALYRELADDMGTALVPFLLEGFATRHEWFQDDGIHPNAHGQAAMADTIWAALEPLLKS